MPKRIIKQIKQLNSDKSGVVAVLSAVVLAALLLVVGAAIDYSRAVSAQQKMQAALDAAVLAAAKNPDADVQSTVEQVFNLNYTDTNPVQVSATRPTPGAASASASQNLPTAFTGIIGFAEIEVGVQSAAAAGSTSAGGKACIIVLDKNASQAFLVNSGADISGSDCEIHVHSTANPAAIFNSGTNIDTAKICIAGSQIIDNGGTHSNLELGCAPKADPYVGTLPTPNTSGCTYSNLNFNGGNVVLSPGVYCGWVNFNNAPNVTFNPGVYVIKQGGWNVNGGNWSGAGVTFYYADTSKIQFNSAVSATLHAPTSGAYEGIVMFEAPGLSRSQFVLNDSLGFDISDLVYLPSRDVTFNSGSGIKSKKFTLVTNTLILNQTKWTIQPGDMASGEMTTAGSPKLLQ